MESHKRVLGIIFITWSLLRILGLLFMMLFFSVLMPLIMHEVSADEQWVVEWLPVFFQALGCVLIFFFAIPGLIAGIGLLNKKSWAVTLALIFGCLGVFNFPIGTAICGYSIWVFLEDNKEKRSTSV